MAISHKVYTKHEIVFSSWVGTITDADILEAYKKLYEDERWKPGFNEIVDGRNAQPGGVTIDGLRQLEKLVERYTAGKCEGFRTAIIAPKDLSYGLGRLYEALSENSPESVRVFRDPGEALKWVGFDEPASE
jgi:hypothetical protein